MKLPLSWLREHLDIDVDADELNRLMGVRGLEVEEVTTPGAGVIGVRTAKVLTREPHPNADKLQLVTVTGEGGEGVVDVVCGATNFEVGDVVAHAFPGTTLPGGFQLTQKELRGVVSNGMLCSTSELEIGAGTDGILILPSDTPLGVDLNELAPLGEPVIEIAVMADRGDHHSVLGVARDLAAILDVAFRDPEVGELPTTPGVPITISADDGCRHFVGVSLTGATDGPSPLWLRLRLHQCGVRSISKVVDVTNYVMLERGQPLHAFDQDRLAGPSIDVRWATDGEQVTTLDDVERTLVTTDMVVCDADRAQALAGVMGGLATEVTDATETILLEAAIWLPNAARDTSKRLNLTSEASNRFARRVDPAGARGAAARATELLVELTGATATATSEAGTADTTAVTSAPLDAVFGQRVIGYDAARYGAFLGLPDLDAASQAALLERSGNQVVVGDTDATVTVPSWRGDLVRGVDLSEEVARLHGYDRIPATMPPLSTQGGRSARQTTLADVRRAAEAGGFHEAITKPFVAVEGLVLVADEEARVKLANPLAQDAGAMRPGIVEGLLDVVRRNVGQGRPGTAVYEIGRVFRRPGGPLDMAAKAFADDFAWTDPEGAVLPTQPKALGIVAQGRQTGPDWVGEDAWEISDLIAVLDEVARRTDPGTLPGERTRVLHRMPLEHPALHPARCAALAIDGPDGTPVVVGVVGQLHPSEAERRNLPEPVLVAELLLDPLVSHVGDTRAPLQARPISNQPAMMFDVAVQASDDVPYAVIAAAVRAGAGDHVDEVWQFDEYRGEQLGDGQRSLGLRLRLQAADRALTEADEQAAIEGVAEAVAAIGATMRR